MNHNINEENIDLNHKSSLYENGSTKKKYVENLPDYKEVILTNRQLCDLELIMNGGFSPLDGFMCESDYTSVVENLRLADGTVWPIPIVLDVNEVSKFKVGEAIKLCDKYHKPLAVLEIEDIYEPDKLKEIKSVYGTEDSSHFGVKYILKNTGKYYIGGKVVGIHSVEHYDFTEHRYTPKELKDWLQSNNWDQVCAFQTRNPIHKAHFTMIKDVFDKHKIKVLINPVVGETNDGDIDYVTRVRSYIKLTDLYAKEFSKLCLLPLAMRMGGPREAVLHAIIRKNYGCTHFIVGRHHAEPKDANGNDFYGEYDAQDLVARYQDEIGITMIPFKEMLYIENEDKYVSRDDVKESHIVRNISGTEFRKRIYNNEEIPSWFSFPEIIAEIKKGVLKEKKDGLAIFFTGLPSSGKTTLSNILEQKLLELQDKKITVLDGDIIRDNLSKGLGFGKEDRIENIKRIGFVANEIVKHGGISICSAISPYEEARNLNRDLIAKNGNYIEVYVSAPLEVCIKRDVKGLYKRALSGELQGMTGINDTYETPELADINVDTSSYSPEESVNQILDYLKEHTLI